MRPVQTQVAVQDGRTLVVDAPPAPAEEPAHHEGERLFDLAPEQLPGQLPLDQTQVNY